MSQLQALNYFVLNFKDLVPFRNYGDSRTTVVE